jgi:hypothetical protein
MAVRVWHIKAHAPLGVDAVAVAVTRSTFVESATIDANGGGTASTRPAGCRRL